MDKNLASKKCVPCAKGTPPLEGNALTQLHDELGGGWQLIDNKQLKKAYHFPDFRHALTFVNLVGEIAEEEGHHPSIFLVWGKVIITLWTHKIQGLSESDFVLAAKCDQEFPKVQKALLY